jgi:hypothetical protein
MAGSMTTSTLYINNSAHFSKIAQTADKIPAIYSQTCGIRR